MEVRWTNISMKIDFEGNVVKTYHAEDAVWLETTMVLVTSGPLRFTIN